MNRKHLTQAECPVARSLEAVGDWWSLLIVRDAFFGKRRFGEFLSSLGVARNILTTRLKKLVAHGILETIPASDGSAYKEYVLTEKAKGLYLVLIALRQWGQGCMTNDGDQEMTLVDRRTRTPIQPLALRSADGRELGPEDVELVAVQ
ncbi:winged helix-turn-helix transcriptional regulator [Zavarzinella formosa]|uniref:winged helix-turn-helix transcriptional regulator n=1 Tax=Zavarzinella formosa TaxID=360055 RepID=UPI000495EDB4|nr:helix-turn-helix domain-containing protein [Zavarzinella formosa]